MQKSTPISSSIGTETSPVYAPSSSKCTFCAPTFISVSLKLSTRVSKAVNGAHIAACTSVPLYRFLNSSAKASASAFVLNIFQFPAIKGILIACPPIVVYDYLSFIIYAMLFIFQAGYSRQFFSFEELK